MAMSALSAPIYLKSLGSAVLRTRGRFVVTPKGGEASPDRIATFRIHLYWAAILVASLVASVHYGHTHAAMRTWASLALVVALAPVTLWAWTTVRARRVQRVRDRARARARSRGLADAREAVTVLPAAVPPTPAAPAPTTTGGN